MEVGVKRAMQAVVLVLWAASLAACRPPTPPFLQPPSFSLPGPPAPPGMPAVPGPVQPPRPPSPW
jgi:hypothetical protein